MANNSVAPFTILRRMLFSISLFALSLIVAQPCFPKTIQWDDFTKGYDKRITFESPKTVTVDLPENLLQENDALILTIKGITTQQNSITIYLIINGNSKEKYALRGSNVSKTITLKTNDLRIGKNEFYFYSLGNAPAFSSIGSISFKLAGKETLASYKNINSASSDNQKTATDERISHNQGTARREDDVFIWEDFTKPLQIDDLTLSFNHWATMRVDLPEAFISSSESVFLRVKIDLPSYGPRTNHTLSLNNGNGRYLVPADKNIRIKTKHLIAGENHIKIKCSNPGGSTLKGLRFDDQSLASYKNSLAHSSTIATAIAPQNQIGKSGIIAPKTNASNPDAIAVVIGNQNYSNKDIPTVEYAKNDAVAIKNYLIDTLGYLDGNIIFETDASKAELEMIFGTRSNYRGMLYNYIKPKKSDVFIYYSGHGAPDPQTSKAYLVPTDCNPAMMDLTAYPLDVLYGNLPKIESKSINVILDACFSGGTNTGKWLIQNASPALIKVNSPVTSQDNIAIFTSAKNNQISSWYPEKQHSMFTYFFLIGVTGNADFNQDREVTYQEIYDFVSDRAEGVPYYAKRLHGGRVQNPTMQAGDNHAVFVKY